MAYQSLYRRYRPRRFDEVRGQEHVVGALRNAVDNNSVTHAYLFSGPRGTGKTSTARILAKALNCENLQRGEPCCECTPCQDMEAGRSFDLFELDAASNNGVDAIRDLIERTAVGSPGRTKVYILDEVHMLSPAASNALLKTLEEPPGHVRFVLATTDPQKVLPTIRSRTQHFEFQLLSADELERYVRWIISDADLDVDEAGIAWAVRQGRGSARDTLSALDQVVAAGGVVERTEPVEQLFEALVSKDSGTAILAVADALAQGHDPRVLAKVFLDALRDTFLLSLGAEVPHMMADDAERMGRWASQIGTPLLTRAMESIGSSMVDMRQAADPRVPFEVALVRLTMPAADSVSGLLERIEKLERALANGVPTHAASEARGSAEPEANRAQRRSTPSAGDEGASHDRARGSAAGDGLSPVAKAKAELARQKQRRDERASTESPTPRPARAQPADAGAPPVPPATTPSPPTPSAAPPVPPSPSAMPAGAEPAEPAEAAAPTPATPPPTAAPEAVGSVAEPSKANASSPGEGDARSDAAQPSPAEGADRSADSAPAGAARASGSDLTVEDLQGALESAVLNQIRGVTKAIYSQGRFTSVADDAAVFAVENSPTRDRAEKARTEVESLLSAHFGRKIKLTITDKGSAGGPNRGSPGSPPTDHRGPATTRRPGSQEAVAGESFDEPPTDSEDLDEEELLQIDVTELEDAKGIAETGLERLMGAFPGSTVIEANEE